jgi:hypothetical protein
LDGSTASGSIGSAARPAAMSTAWSIVAPSVSLGHLTSQRIGHASYDFGWHSAASSKSATPSTNCYGRRRSISAATLAEQRAIFKEMMAAIPVPADVEEALRRAAPGGRRGFPVVEPEPGQRVAYLTIVKLSVRGVDC